MAPRSARGSAPADPVLGTTPARPRTSCRLRRERSRRGIPPWPDPIALVQEESMKRILSVLTLAAALAVIGGTVAATRLHAAKQHVSAQPASASVCADAAHCPAGSCPVGSKSAAVASAPEDENGATSNP